MLAGLHLFIKEGDGSKDGRLKVSTLYYGLLPGSFIATNCLTDFFRHDINSQFFAMKRARRI